MSFHHLFIAFYYNFINTLYLSLLIYLSCLVFPSSSLLLFNYNFVSQIIFNLQSYYSIYELILLHLIVAFYHHFHTVNCLKHQQWKYMGCEFKYHWKIVLHFYLTLFTLTVNVYFTYKVVMKSNVNEEKTDQNINNENCFINQIFFLFYLGLGPFIVNMKIFTVERTNRLLYSPTICCTTGLC